MQYRQKPTHKLWGLPILVKASSTRACLSLVKRLQQARSRVRIIAAVSMGALVVITGLSIMQAAPASAAPQDSQAECEAAGGTWISAPRRPTEKICFGLGSDQGHPTDFARSVSLYNALRNCIAIEERHLRSTAPGDTTGERFVSEEDAINGLWWTDDTSGFLFTTPSRPASYLVQSEILDDGKLSCNKILAEGLKEWGYTNGKELICDAGIRRDNNASCQTGTDGNFYIGKDEAPVIAQAIRTKAGFSATPTLGDIHLYPIYFDAFIKGCSAQVSLNGVGDRNYPNIDIVTGEGGAARIESTRFEGIPNGDKRFVYTNTDLQEVEASCKVISERVSEYAQAFRDWQRNNDGILQQGPGGGRACIDNPDDPSCVDNQSTCGVEGIGWIICPALTFLAGITDESFKLIEQFLQINPALLDQESDTYAFWQVMRDFANVAFVIVFLIIIFSQLTNLGVGNYGVKKTLPRLIVGAILVNVSFFVCQLAVDISNITGASIYQLLTTLPTGAGETDASGNAGGWILVIAGAILAGGAAILAISVPVLLAALLAVAVILLILMARFAIVIMLTVLAPLAFVALLLPNTEQLFKKWLKLFTSMLVLYPIVALVFGASTVAAQIIANAGGEIDDGLLQVTALGVAALPLILIPSILKNSLNAAGALGTKLSSLSSKANGRIGSKIGSTSRLGESQKAFSQRMAQGRARRRATSPIASKIDQGWVGRRMGWDKGAAAASSISNKAENDDVSAAEVLMRSKHSDPTTQLANVATEFEDAVEKGDVVRARAAQKILLAGGNKGRTKLRESITRAFPDAASKTSDVGKSVRADLNAAGLKGSDVLLNNWAFNNGSVTDTLADPATFSGLNGSELAGQPPDVLRAAAISGHITTSQAKELVDNATVFKDLDEYKKAVLRSAAGEGPMPRAP